MITTSQQLGFDELLETARIDNEQRRTEARLAHLPSDLGQAVELMRGLIEEHHAAILAGDYATAMTLRGEAGLLVERLNGGTRFGSVADDTAPGCVLMRETAAPAGAVPLWGQQGTFVATALGVRCRVEIAGLLGLFCSHQVFPGFAIHAVDLDRPFLSETGYRHFAGPMGHHQIGQGVDRFAVAFLTDVIRVGMRGKLVAIDDPHRRT